MSSAFKKNLCTIPQVWCGKSDTIPRDRKDKYYKIGDRTECMKFGFGAGSAIERTKNLDPNSLRNIKYLGEKYEEKFTSIGIKDLKSLIKEMKGRTSLEVDRILKRVLMKSNQVLDVKAYNSVLLYLYNNGNGNIPQCKKITL